MDTEKENNSMVEKDKEIDKLADGIFECVDREFIDKFIEDENGNLTSVQSVSIYSIAEHLLDKGYRRNADVLQSEKEVQKKILDEVVDRIKGTIYVCNKYGRGSFTQDNIVGLKRALKMIGEVAKCKDIETSYDSENTFFDNEPRDWIQLPYKCKSFRNGDWFVYYRSISDYSLIKQQAFSSETEADKFLSELMAGY